nr:transporter substrate-binding protein [Leptolyngbya sp. FACHB-541]
MNPKGKTSVISAIAGSTVKVGILHSLAGPWAIGEIALKDAEMMAITEINQSGGVLGKQIEPIVADGASEPVIFEQQTRKLIEQDQVVTIFGCWTSTVRKFIVPTLERLNALLWYPVQYEGLECSKSIFYTAVCPNQQIEPAVQWLLQNKGKRFYLVGSDIVFSRTASKIIRARLKQQGGTVLGEDYVPVGGMDFRQIIANIKRTKPDVVFSTVNTDSNLGFYPQYREAGIDAEDIPILAVSVTEEEIQQLGVESAVGHYAAHSYFQSLKNLRNQTFVKNFKATYGADRVTSDSVESAYVQVYLWKQAVEQAQSFEVDHVRLAAYGQAMQTPGGMVRVEQNHHLWKPCRIGKVRPNGQFDLVQVDDELIKPQPWLGMDDVKFDASTLVTDMLAEAAQAILYNCQLEQKSRELIEANDRLQKLTQRAELFKRSLSSQIRNSLELDTILTTAVTEIRNLLQIDRCKFLWYLPNTDPARFDLSHEACDQDLLPNLAHYPVRDSEVLREVILRSSILQVDDVATTTRLDATGRSQLANLGFKSLLTVVVQTRSGRLGVIVCEHVKQARPWRDHEVELLRDVADQLAIAIDQAELYSQTRTAALQAQIQAQQLQQALYDLQATQAQLVQTEKMSSLGQLVAGIAHEINNPVSFIYGNIDHASDYTQDLLNLVKLYRQHYPNPVPEIQTEVETIDFDFLVTDLPKILTSMRVGSERIRQIVLSLRSFSRLDEAEMKPVDIHEGIDNTLLILQNRLRTDAKSAGIKIIKRYDDLPLIDCYAGQMNQVFMNLLVNAIDALEMVGECAEVYQRSTTAEYSSPAIEIQTQMHDPDWVSIRIADNGPGIPEIFQQRLFDPFFTTKPIGKGTGLGLAISHRIVIEKHQGRLYYSSNPGRGTEFFIEIPVRQLKDKENMSLTAELSDRR